MDFTKIKNLKNYQKIRLIQNFLKVYCDTLICCTTGLFFTFNDYFI